MKDIFNDKFNDIIKMYWAEVKENELDKTLDLFYALSEKSKAEFLEWLAALIYTPDKNIQIKSFFKSL